MTASPAVATVPVLLGHLALRDYRNLASVDLEVPAEGLVLVGRNGQGKTNLLEAVHVAHALRSFRGSRDQDLVRFGSPAAFLGFSLRGAAVQRLGVGIPRDGGGKRLTLDGVESSRVTDAFATLPSVVVSPRDVALVAGPPQERRRYLDLMLSCTVPGYLAALQRYRAALVRRNAALRAAPDTPNAELQVAVWEPALIDAGTTIWLARRAWVANMSRQIADLCEAIGEGARFAARLQGTARDAGRGGEDTEGLRSEFAAQLAADRHADLQRGMTLHGPHRDDLLLLLGGKMARSFGSAGQQRTIAIAMRLAEARTMFNASGRLPLLLFDDPFAELDRQRAARVLEVLSAFSGAQKMLAVPRADEVPGDFVALPRWSIEGGVIDAT
jgi:DNA replication and repair protein RecF